MTPGHQQKVADLVSKNWRDHPNGYIIKSKLTEKDQNRINDIMRKLTFF